MLQRPQQLHSLAQKFRPYAELARIDKPIGSYLLFIPGAWSICLASNFIPISSMEHISQIAPATTLALLGKFALGSFIMRGAGCTINDILDAKFDSQVERTKNRPLARGAIATKEAAGFLLIQLAAGFSVLLSLNTYSIMLGSASVIPVLLYPLAKRITYWPQLFLGLTFNWGALLGWTSVVGGFGENFGAPVALYFSSVVWTLIYDTIYAHQDKEDDKIVGVKSTALLFGQNTKFILNGLTCIWGVSMTMTGILSDLGTYFYLVSVLGGSTHILSQIHRVDLDDRNSCHQAFKSNFWTGNIILSGILLDKLLL